MKVHVGFGLPVRPLIHSSLAAVPCELLGGRIGAAIAGLRYRWEVIYQEVGRFLALGAALDGGRILFVLIELVRGKPIAPEREGMVHLVGMALLLSAMVLLMFNDVVNPVTDMMR